MIEHLPATSLLHNGLPLLVPPFLASVAILLLEAALTKPKPAFTGRRRPGGSSAQEP